MKALIVSAGPSGLAATYRLKTRGIDVTAFEGAPQADGLAYGYYKDGYLIDAGAQFAAPFYGDENSAAFRASSRSSSGDNHDL